MHEIREKFVHEFMREFAQEFVHEFMPENYVFKEKTWGKVSVSLIVPKIFQCRVLSAWADIDIQYVNIIKGNILIEIFYKLCVTTQAFRNINFIHQGFSFLF